MTPTTKAELKLPERLFAQSCTLQDGDCKFVAMVSGWGADGRQRTRELTAELVHRYNAHEEMVKALERTLKYLRSPEPEDAEYIERLIERAIHRP